MIVPVGFDPFAADDVTFHTTGGVLSTGADPVGLIFMFEGEEVPPSEELRVAVGSVRVAALPYVSVTFAPPATSEFVAT